MGEMFPFLSMHGEVRDLVGECAAELYPGVHTPFHKLEESICLFLLGSRADGDKGFRGITEGKGVDKAAALEEGGLTMNAASVILVPLPDTNDTIFGGMPKGHSGVVHLLSCSNNCCNSLFMFCKLLFSGWCPCCFHPCYGQISQESP